VAHTWNKYWAALPKLIVANVHQAEMPLHHRAVDFSRHCVVRRPKSCCSPPMMVANVVGGLVMTRSISSITTLNGVVL
jgi:hypothetical protein